MGQSYFERDHARFYAKPTSSGACFYLSTAPADRDGFRSRCYPDHFPNYARKLAQLLTTDLTFKGQRTNYATHNLHAFAAKFPRQLPGICLFIDQLTRPGEHVLSYGRFPHDHSRSGASRTNRKCGSDLDPLAVLLAQIKTSVPDLTRLIEPSTTYSRRRKTAVFSLGYRWRTKPHVLLGDHSFLPLLV